jgi:ribosomal protein L29
MTKAVTLREKDTGQLHDLVATLRREHLKLRMQKSQGDEVKIHRFKEIRCEIARVLTVITEKERAK